ncbi:lipoprotein, putative [hydrothermal vent metagenome]|uniref:Lipoprotein, putative n=1 Tax=hydrothermal vent metagenome TaxID=652676 RepID=A0A1W1EEZ8_9ZZZZ
MKQNRLLIASAALVGLLALSGCASTSETMMQQGYGPDYSHGYEDGCNSGKQAGGSMFDQFTKNVNQYDKNHKYREGWNDGFRVCNGQEKEMLHNIESAQRTNAEEHIADELHNR